MKNLLFILMLIYCPLVTANKPSIKITGIIAPACTAASVHWTYKKEDAYDLDLSINGGPYRSLLINSKETSYVYMSPDKNSVYSFRLRISGEAIWVYKTLNTDNCEMQKDDLHSSQNKPF